MCFNLIPIPFWPRSAGHLSGYPAMSSSDSTLIKFAVAILVPGFILMFFGSDFESQTSALCMAFCITQRKVPNHRLLVQFRFRFDIIHRPSDPLTLRPSDPSKMSFPQNTSYIDVVNSFPLHLFYPSFSHLMSSLWPLGVSSPLSQRLVELTDVDDDLGVESSDPDRIPIG